MFVGFIKKKKTKTKSIKDEEKKYDFSLKKWDKINKQTNK